MPKRWPAQIPYPRTPKPTATESGGRRKCAPAEFAAPYAMAGVIPPAHRELARPSDTLPNLDSAK